MSVFTCITCHVAFANSEFQRDHYKSDWHRYNLKRKVADLPPVTAINFQERALSQQSRGVNQVEDPANRYCTYCHKNFGTSNSFDNHVSSKKHLEIVERYDEKVRTEIEKKNAKNAAKSGFGSSSTDARLPSALASSLNRFDQMRSQAPAGKVDPKKAAASYAAALAASKAFSTNEDDYEGEYDSFGSDEDMEEWEDAEGEPLGLEECLFCSFLSSSLEDNVKHMTEVHSFFIPDIEYLVDLEGLVAYLAEKVGVGNVCLWCSNKGKTFYTVKSVQQHMVDKGHCKMLHEEATLEEYADFYDYSSSYPDAEPAATAEGEGAVAAGGADEEVSIEEIGGDEFQLVLPSGATIGHRSLMRYYRQHLRPARPTPNKKLLSNVMSHYRGLGWTGTTGEAAILKAKSISLMHIRRSKHNLRMGVINNRVLQKHYRHQNPL